MKMRNPKIKGVFVPLVTPLKRNKKLDKRGLKRLIRTLKPKVDGFVPGLSTGEGRYLGNELFAKLLEATVLFAGDLPIIAGIEQEDTKGVISRIKITQSLGIKTVAVLPPFGKNIPQENTYAHFARIAELDVEILVYNKEMMCGTAIELDTLARLSKIENVVAIKEGSADPQFTRRVLDSVEGVAIMQAWDDLLTEVKTHGSIVPLSNLEPELCRIALGTCSEEMRRKVNEAVTRFNLEAENPTWYKDVKKELVKRGIIKTAVLVEDQ